jgi:hypothetical protein
MDTINLSQTTLTLTKEQIELVKDSLENLLWQIECSDIPDTDGQYGKLSQVREVLEVPGKTIKGSISITTEI